MKINILLIIFLFSIIPKTECKKKVTLEVLFVLDHAVYKKAQLLQIRPDVLKSIYYSVFLGVKKNLEAMKLQDYQLNAKLIDLVISKTPEESAFTEVPETKIDSERIGTFQALDSFIKWLVEKKENIRKHHVAVLFSSYKMVELPGASFIATVCNGKSASVVQESGQFAMIDQTTHEIAHQLGAEEDGQSNNCDMKDQYIMAPQRMERNSKNYRNYETFSRCSLRSIKENLDKLSKNNSFCLVPHRGSVPINIKSYLREPVGKSLKLDQQCQAYYGSSSFYCAGGGKVESSLCAGMNCWDAVNGRCDKDVRMLPYVGTPCGNMKVCKNRKCVQDSKGIRTKDQCIYGDYKGFWDAYPIKLTCSHLAKNSSFYCNREDNREMCCDTCNKIKKMNSKIQNCEYGDKISGCRLADCGNSQCCSTCKHTSPSYVACSSQDNEPWCPYVQAYDCYEAHTACCRTCRTFKSVKNIYNCKYGDREGWCKEYVKKDPSICKSSMVKVTCCEACSEKLL